jgi:hypothetical protein
MMMRYGVCNSKNFTPCGESETINTILDNFKINDSRYELTMPRVKWYFSADYIAKRLSSYLPFLLPLAKVVPSGVIIPVNLFDSLVGIFTR